MAINTWFATRLDHQAISMPNLSCSLFVMTTTGLGVIICCLFLLALLQLFNLKTILLTGILLGSVASIFLVRSKISWRQAMGIEKFDKTDLYWTLPLLLSVSVLLLYPMKPPVAWDELSYHLPYAKFYLQNEGLAVNEFLRFPLHTHNLNLLYALGLAVSDELFVHTLHAGCAFLIVLGLFGLCRVYFGHIVAFLSVLIFFSFDVTRNLLGTAYVEYGLVLFLSLAFFALMLWERYRERRWLILSAFGLGMSMGTKYVGIVFTPLLGLWVLFHNRSFATFLRYALVTAFFGLSWYIRNAWISGNPIHPLAGDLFGYYIWSANDVAAHNNMIFGIERSFTNFLAMPFYLMIKPGYFKCDFGGLSILAMPFFITPLLFTFLDRSVRVPIVIVWAYIIYWFISIQMVRYLMPILPIMAMISSVVIVRVAAFLDKRIKQTNNFRNTGYINALIILLFIIGFIVTNNNRRDIDTFLESIKYARMNNKEIEHFLADHNQGYELMQHANKHLELKRQPIYQLGFENAVYFYDGVVMGDWFGPARYGQMYIKDPDIEKRILKAPEVIKEKILSLKAKAIVINHNRFGNYNRQAFAQYFRLVKENRFGALYFLKD